MISKDPRSPLSKWNIIIISIAIVIGLIYMIVATQDSYDRYGLLKGVDTEYVEGRILQLDGIVSKKQAKYTYSYKGDSFEGFFLNYLPCRSKRNSREARESIIQVEILVAVDPQNPEISYPLIAPEDYRATGKEPLDVLVEIYREYILCE